MSRARYWTAFVLSLIGIAVLVNLGLWQVDRLQWKEAILTTIAERTSSEPIDVSRIATIVAETGDVEYMPGRVTGRFLHEGERFFLSTFDGQAGWNVYTPLLVTGTSNAIFVNRGFVPYPAKDPATRVPGQIEGETTITGLARNAPAEKPADFIPDNDPAQNVFFWKDIDAMAERLDLPAGVTFLPFLIDAGPGEAPGGYPVGGVTVIDVPNNHLQYAITWFSLATILAVMFAILVVSRARRRA